MRWLVVAIVLGVVAAPPPAASVVCDGVRDRAVCESKACAPTHAWCMICDACLEKHRAVKDEL
jgi:hypothetical protein